jgi:hypothetical protein
MLPNDFVFSQSSLQDFVDCPRRFELRYILRQSWPALESEPVLEQERRMQQGDRFHQLVHQLLIGIPSQILTPPSSQLELSFWWQNFLQFDPLSDLPTTRYVEKEFSAPYNGYRMMAKYDLLAIEPGQRAVIVDWKTSITRPRSTSIKRRIQSRLYPFLLSLAGSVLNDGIPLPPEQIEMIYWFPNDPTNPEHIHYSERQFVIDQEEIGKIITAIHQLSPGKFMLAGDEKVCSYCRYRSLCERGLGAGDINAMEDDAQSNSDISMQIDFDQIGEISF